jgi:hypothetical protein
MRGPTLLVLPALDVSEQVRVLFSLNSQRTRKPSRRNYGAIVLAPTKPRRRSAGRAPGSAAGDAPASGPLPPRCADARPHVDTIGPRP